MKNVAQETKNAISGAIKIDEKELNSHLDDMVRKSVEDTLNALLNAEADAICNAGRYQRTPDRLDTRAGSYHRKLLTKAGEVDLKVPHRGLLPEDEMAALCGPLVSQRFQPVPVETYPRSCRHAEGDPRAGR